MNTPVARPGRGLYLLTPDEADTGRLMARMLPLLELGPARLQYRNKGADPALRRRQARELLSACRERGVPLLINDDWRLAADLGADGVHLGRDDGAITEARAALGPTALVGASCYQSLDHARQAVAEGADHVAFGAFFPSGTKPLATPAPLALLSAAADLGVPRVAIGGIGPDNAASVIAAGADLVAVIGAVFQAPDPVAAARTLLSLFEAKK